MTHALPHAGSAVRENQHSFLATENDMDLDDWVAVVAVFSLNLMIGIGLVFSAAVLAARYL